MTLPLPTSQDKGLLFPLDFHELVNRVADRFERQTGMKVSTGSRHELIQPALPYRDHVMQELANGQITMDFLESSIQTVLDNAREIADEIGQDHIGENTTRESFKRDCPYLFWC